MKEEIYFKGNTYYGYVPLILKEGVFPKNYLCSECGRDSTALWINQDAYLIKLFCLDCACKSQGTEKLGRGFKIGYLVPAIPADTGGNYYRFGSASEVEFDWWESAYWKNF